MDKKTKKYWSTYALLFAVILIFGGLSMYVYTNSNQVATSVVATTTVIDKVGDDIESDTATPESIYPNTKSMQIGSTTVEASVAESWTDRIRGLSDTPYLPENIVKLFIFDSSGYHSIWMKDMNYSIDIIWVSEAGTVVHTESGAAPESFPAMFVPETPAKYVIETVDGFVVKNNIIVGTSVVLPNL